MEKLIANKLRAMRLENRFSLEYVASMIGVHRETYRRYENGPYQIDIGDLVKILSLYNTSPIIFFEEIYGKMPMNN